MRAIALFLTILVAQVGCSQPQTLVGVWQHKFDTTTETVEFLRDGTFRISSSGPALKQVTKQDAVVVFNGRYSIIDSNHIQAYVATGTQTNFIGPATLSYSLSGNELRLTRFTMAGDMEVYRRNR